MNRKKQSQKLLFISVMFDLSARKAIPVCQEIRDAQKSSN